MDYKIKKNFWKNKKVFITGHTGFKGSWLCAWLHHLVAIVSGISLEPPSNPFHFEGAQRMKLADKGLEELQQYVDTLLTIPNQNLFKIANEKTTFADAFKMADDVLYAGVRGVTDLMVLPGLINLVFSVLYQLRLYFVKIHQ